MVFGNRVKNKDNRVRIVYAFCAERESFVCISCFLHYCQRTRKEERSFDHYVRKERFLRVGSWGLYEGCGLSGCQSQEL